MEKLRVKAHAPCTRLKPSTRLRCGEGAIGVLVLEHNGVKYMVYVCPEHFQEPDDG